MQKRFMSQLNLSPAQKAQLKALRMRMKEQAQKVRASNASPDQKKARMKELHMHARDQMMSVLNPGQRAKLQAMRAQFRKNHPGFHKNGVGKIQP